jgi:hypothetical protein
MPCCLRTRELNRIFRKLAAALQIEHGLEYPQLHAKPGKISPNAIKYFSKLDQMAFICASLPLLCRAKGIMPFCQWCRDVCQELFPTVGRQTNLSSFLKWMLAQAGIQPASPPIATLAARRRRPQQHGLRTAVWHRNERIRCSIGPNGLSEACEYIVLPPRKSMKGSFLVTTSDAASYT